MITEIVIFDLPDDMDRDRVMDLYEQSAEGWRKHPKLHRKNYLYDPDKRIGGGVYTWDSVEDAQEAHGEAFVARVKQSFGSAPSFQYFETPVVVQNHPAQG